MVAPTSHPNDIFLWPDGSWCYREEGEDVAAVERYNYRVLSAFGIEWSGVVSDPLHLSRKKLQHG